MADAAHQITGPQYFKALPSGESEDDDIVKEGQEETRVLDEVITTAAPAAAATSTTHDVHCSVVDVPPVPTRWVHACPARPRRRGRHRMAPGIA